ncbi:MAG: TIGR04283 family arsenosugar biosynthesis glycosyltransferase [Proteobacteria bacterium]|nr:TIGR04283 family arsenosugar biosynthesis glycosyltransferase [Pseudomonadota bacterium]
MRAVAAIFAKPPEPGRTKTRLIPLVGARGAARLAEVFLADAWATLQSHDSFEAVVSTTETDPRRFALEPAPMLWDQGQGDLGARIERTLQRGLADHDAAFAIGADSPDLSAAQLDAALQSLRGNDAVVIPSADGGFVLLGLKHCPKGLLAQLPWSTATTCDRTVERLRSKGLSVEVLPSWFDVDEPAELRELAKRLEHVPERAPHTAALLRAEPLPARISVIIPTLDEATRIGAQLDRLLAETGIDEVVVTDGGSTDGTLEICKSRGVRVICGPPGRARQMNAGAAATTGDLLWFVHADVRLPEGAPRRVRHALRDPDTAAGAFKTWTVNDHAPRPWGVLLHAADLRSRVTAHPYGDQAVFMRREVFDQIGGFPDLELMEDVAMAERLLEIGRIATVDARVTVSGRRFVRRPLRTMLAWNTLPWLYRHGVPSHVLHWLYGNVR